MDTTVETEGITWSLLISKSVKKTMREKRRVKPKLVTEERGVNLTLACV